MKKNEHLEDIGRECGFDWAENADYEMMSVVVESEVYPKKGTALWIAIENYISRSTGEIVEQLEKWMKTSNENDNNLSYFFEGFHESVVFTFDSVYKMD